MIRKQNNSILKIKRKIGKMLKSRKKNVFYKKYSLSIIKHQLLNLNIFYNMICDNK